jgi:hypothetical protein
VKGQPIFGQRLFQALVGANEGGGVREFKIQDVKIAAVPENKS